MIFTSHELGHRQKKKGQGELFFGEQEDSSVKERKEGWPCTTRASSEAHAQLIIRRQKTNSRGARHVPKQPRLHAETWAHTVSRETTSEKKRAPPGKEEGGLGKRKKPSDLTLKRRKAGLKALGACVYA